MKHSGHKIASLIGADTHITGDINFTGVLHLQGTINGSVTCEADGLMVIDGPGTLTGTLSVTQALVHGRMLGPVKAFETLTVTDSGRIDGDIEYAAIEVHAEGVINGLLTPCDDSANSASRSREGPLRSDESQRAGRRRITAAVIVVAAVVITSLAIMRFREIDPGETTNIKTTDAPAAANEPTTTTAPLAIFTASLPPAQSSEPPLGLQDTNLVAKPDPPTMIEGTNPNKPSDVVWVIANEAAILFKKERDDPGPGARIELAQGGTKTITISRGEILRVAQGIDIELLYQGRKVAPKMVRSGQWLGFTPHPRSRVTSG